jgi:hypothetical protein
MSQSERLALIVAVALGILVRVLPVAGAAAAVGDGGLFYAMVGDIRSAGLVLPHVSSYNGLDIPFVYPPLALWLGAFVGEITGSATMTVVAWMPVVVSIGTIFAFAWVAWRVLPPLASVGATFTYALMPHAYDWVIAGGGLTRGVGLLFALVAAAIAADRGNASSRSAAAAGLLLGLAALSHPQAAVFGVVACVVLSWQPATRAWLARLVVATAMALIVVLPWLISAISAHGIDVLLGAGQRLEPITGFVRMLNLRFSGAPFMDVFAVAGVIGLFASLVRGALRLPILLLVTYLVGAGGGEFLGAVPWALLGGVGAGVAVEIGQAGLGRLTRQRGRLVGAAVGAAVLFLALIASFGSLADRSSKLQSLSADQIAAMEWVSTNADPSASVIVATTEVWGDDEVSEWFPALARRASVGTVQGSEWLGREGFETRLERHFAILACAGSTTSCYANIDPNAWIFVPKGRLAGPFSPDDCCPALRETVGDAGYEIIYDGPGATIAQPSG